MVSRVETTIPPTTAVPMAIRLSRIHIFSFAAGQATADLVITFEKAQLKEEYSFQISLEAAAVDVYKRQLRQFVSVVSVL